MKGTDENPEGLSLGKRYMIGKYIAGGSFGKLYMGKNINTSEEVAIKMEKKDIEKPQLLFEYSFFRKLKADGREQHKGIPRIHYFGPCGPWSCLVMDLLGPSLEKVHARCNNKFTLKTTAQLTIQIIDIFKYFHGKGLIYRDTKPENFLFGLSGTDKYNVVHLIDLGLSKEYLDDNNQHIPFVDGKGVTGTVRYMSVNNHLGFEVSRRDDLEAVGYMVVYFIKSELPWMGLKAGTTKEKYKAIEKVKKKYKPDQLCADLPKEFAVYLNSVKSLQFEETPEYNDYIKLFEKLLERTGHKKDSNYDFDRQHKPITRKN